MTTEPSLTDRVRELLPAIEKRAQETERLRRVPDETIAELKEAGLTRALQPERYGGLEGSALDFLRAVMEVGSVCGSTSWVFAVIAVHGWQLAQFPERAQDDVWGADSDGLISSAYAPTGTVERVDGGFLLSGRWGFSSGCDHCQWAFLGGMAPTTDGTGTSSDFRSFMLPRSEYEIDDDWHVAGLAGTGSKVIVVEDGFVPEHRTHKFADANNLTNPGMAVNTGPLYRFPFGTLFAYAIAAPIVGMARGAKDAYLNQIRTKVGAYTGAQVALDPFAQATYARASSEVEAAWTSVERNFTAMEQSLADGVDIALSDRARYRWDAANSVAVSADAADRVFAAAGGRSIYLDNAIQRHWRDARCGAVHAIHNPHDSARLFTGDSLGQTLPSGALL
jgi:3-hydroxy-9,10-secoandrosta-1,3,5(10)-triene-9,17-dione monooxygenase